MSDFYERLNVSKNASQNEVKSQFRKLAKKYHPDKNKNEDTTNKFVEIYEAFETLNDPEKRNTYDKILSDNVKEKGISSSNNVHRTKKGYYYASMNFEEFINSNFYNKIYKSNQVFNQISFFSTRLFRTIISIISLTAIVGFSLSSIFELFAEEESFLKQIISIIIILLVDIVALFFVLGIGSKVQNNITIHFWKKQFWLYTAQEERKNKVSVLLSLFLQIITFIVVLTMIFIVLNTYSS